MYATHSRYDEKREIVVTKHVVSSFSPYVEVNSFTDEDSSGNHSTSHDARSGFNVTALCGEEFQTEEIETVNDEKGAHLCKPCRRQVGE